MVYQHAEGVANYFHTLYQRGQDPAQPDWASWRMPTAMNPHVPAVEIEAARQDLSEAAWSQEYDARFVSWEGAVFRRILDAIAEPPAHVPAVAIGVDWGRSNDYTVFTGISTGGQVLAIDRFRGLEYSLQRAAFKLSGNALAGYLGSSRKRTAWAAF